MHEIIIAIGTAVLSTFSTLAVTKIKSNHERDVVSMNTEADRVGLYLDNLNELLDRYQSQIDDLRKEVKALTNENRKLRAANQDLIDQIAELRVKFNSME